MNKKVFTLIAFATCFLTTIASINLPHTPVQAETDVRFICAASYDAETGKRSRRDPLRGAPTTFAWTPRGKIAIVRFQTEYFKNWAPLERCEEVAPRFHKAYHNDSINITLLTEP